MGIIVAFALFCLCIGLFFRFMRISASKFFYVGGVLTVLLGLLMFFEDEISRKDAIINCLAIAFGIGLIVSGFLFFREISIGMLIETVFNKLFFWVEYFI